MEGGWRAPERATLAPWAKRYESEGALAPAIVLTCPASPHAWPPRQSWPNAAAAMTLTCYFLQPGGIRGRLGVGLRERATSPSSDDDDDDRRVTHPSSPSDTPGPQPLDEC